MVASSQSTTAVSRSFTARSTTEEHDGFNGRGKQPAINRRKVTQKRRDDEQKSTVEEPSGKWH